MRFPSLLAPLVFCLAVQCTTGDHNHGQPPSPHDLTRISDVSRRGLVDDLWNRLKNAPTCASCEGLAVFGDKPLIKTIQGLCKISRVQDADVCDGSIALEGPIVAEVLRKMAIGSRASRIFCNSVLGLCDYPSVEPWNVPLPSPEPIRRRPGPSGKKPIKVVHYSDIHIDPLYVPGSSSDCKKPICCRPYTEADEPGKSKSPAGPNGDHKCDVPVSLEESMYRAINEVAPDAAFTLFTGDIVDHAIWNTSQAYNTHSIVDAYDHMNATMKMVYGTAGNHEASPVNAFQPRGLGKETQWLYDLLSQKWSQSLGTTAVQGANGAGWYSAKYPHGNLRVISLNTNLYYLHNFWMFINMDEKDPNGQIAWLVQELDAAEKAGENVYIIGHMPLGESDAFLDGSNYLDQVVKRYSSTIAAMFFGHTHLDHFEISYTDYSSPSANNAFMTSYIAPSLTPTSGMPSFRVYEVDPETFGVLDVTTYIADMDNAAFQSSSGPVWTKLYSAKDAYGSAVSPPVLAKEAELTPSFWHQLTKSFESDDNLFKAYLSRKSRGWNVGNCDANCKSDELCRLRAARAQDNCHKASPGVNLSKRDGGAARGAHDDCGPPVTVQTFHALGESRDTLHYLTKRLAEEQSKALHP